jgi:hypothetical protein
MAMLIEHEHQPSVFDPGHCRPCAHEAGLLDHYHRVQREEAHLRQARAWASATRTYATWPLGTSDVAVLLAFLTLLTG